MRNVVSSSRIAGTGKPIYNAITVAHQCPFYPSKILFTMQAIIKHFKKEHVLWSVCDKMFKDQGHLKPILADSIWSHHHQKLYHHSQLPWVVQLWERNLKSRASLQHPMSQQGWLHQIQDNKFPQKSQTFMLISLKGTTWTGTSVVFVVKLVKPKHCMTFILMSTTRCTVNFVTENSSKDSTISL